MPSWAVTRFYALAPSILSFFCKNNSHKSWKPLEKQLSCPKKCLAKFVVRSGSDIFPQAQQTPKVDCFFHQHVINKIISVAIDTHKMGLGLTLYRKRLLAKIHPMATRHDWQLNAKLWWKGKQEVFARGKEAFSQQLPFQSSCLGGSQKYSQRSNCTSIIHVLRFFIAWF